MDGNNLGSITTETKDIKYLLISSNVGSIFEDPRLIRGWVIEQQLLIQKFQPQFVAFSFQVYCF
jgi:hypothetical protein